MTRAKDISKIVTDADLSGTLDVTGEVNLSANLNLGDNDKAIFGAGSDLQIYHDGNNSYIDEQGTGNIKYRAASRHQFENTDSSKIYMQLVGDTVGQEFVQLRYNNATKLATTATGIEVTDTVNNTPTINIKSSDTVVVADDVVGAITFEESDATGGTGVQAFIKAIANDSGNTYDMSIGVGGNTEAIRIDQSGNVGIGTSPSDILHIKDASSTNVIIDAPTDNASLTLQCGSSDAGAEGAFVNFIQNTTSKWQMGMNTDNTFRWYNYNTSSEAMQIDSNGNLLVGKTSVGVGNLGIELRNNNLFAVTRANDPSIYGNRTGTDGDIIELRKDNVKVGSIGADTDDLTIGTGDTGFRFRDAGDDILPFNMSTGVDRDNAIDLGDGGARFDDIYATNATIQTSDQNEKNTITNSDLGIDFIKRLTPKSYIFNGKTRTHYGLIAQDVETVLSDISKPTSGFAGFIKSDISEEQDGSQYRYGLRYTEFVAPLIQAVKDQQATIDALTARIAALENGE